MHIEDFKTWHWVVLGPIIGLMFAGVILYRGSTADVEGLETLDQGHFERAMTNKPGRRKGEALISQYAPNLPAAKQVVVHPPLTDDKEGKYWVTGKYLSVDTRPRDPTDAKSKTVVWAEWRPFRFPAPAPYRAVNGVPGAYPTVMAYLDVLKKTPSVTGTPYSYAWWDGTAATLALLAAAGFLIIGVAWPLTISVMQGAGLAKIPEPKKVKLPKRKARAAAAALDHAADDDRLNEMNAQLEASLAAGASSGGRTAAAAASAEGPVKALTGGPATDPASVAAAVAEQERLIREYGGEFYPVAKTTHKEPEKSENNTKK